MPTPDSSVLSNQKTMGNNMPENTPKYPYTSPHQMTPMLPSAAKMDQLRPLTAEVIGKAKDLAAQGMPHLRALLRETLRPMNSFYTNKIEGQHTEPLLIDNALRQDFSSKPDEALKQRIALAHIETERWADDTYRVFDALAFFAPSVIQSIHEHLHAQLTPEDLVQLDSNGQEEIIVPGVWRSRGVVIGKHIAPDPATVPIFIEAWGQQYQVAKAGENALIALIASHHRLAWIHPFVDGNGRTARLHTHIGLASLGLTQGLWSPMRGLARDQQNYYAHLIGADQPRQGDLDGRGNLTEAGLMQFIEYLLHICLDQITFMQATLDMNRFAHRITEMLAAEATKSETKYLKGEAVIPLNYLASHPSLDRTTFRAMMGLSSRTADRVLADLFKLKIIRSKSAKGPIELALPLALFRYLFPRLWPEAEVSFY
jgi:Fic family protein